MLGRKISERKYKIIFLDLKGRLLVENVVGDNYIVSY